LTLTDVPKFLMASNMSERDAKQVTASVANIPIAAQTMLPNYGKRPMKGDLFEGKPDVWTDENLWPVGKAEVDADDADDADTTDDTDGDKNEKDEWL